MSSKEKRKIARQNGAKAAGSKTPEGIAISSMNAVRHGLAAKSLVLTNESMANYLELLQAYRNKFKPQDKVESDLIDQMVAAQWRIRRLWTMQTAALDLKMDQQEAEIAAKFTVIDQPTRASYAFTTLANEEKALELYLRYEISYTRMYDRAQRALLRLRNEKLQNDPNSAPPVPDIAENQGERAGQPDQEQTESGIAAHPQPASEPDSAPGSLSPVEKTSSASKECLKIASPWHRWFSIETPEERE